MDNIEEDHIEVKFSEPAPTRVLLEEDLRALETVSDLLAHYAKVQPIDSEYFTIRTRNALLSIAKSLNDRVKEVSIDYEGEKYVIMARGRRRLSMSFKREPDIYIGSDWGVNFIDACRNFFLIDPHRESFNRRKNTFGGRILFGLPVKDVYNYESEIETTAKGYSVTFKLCNQTYTLACEKSRGNAELQRKLLNRTFENLMTLKKTKP